MGIIPLFRICAPQISLQRQLTNVFRLLLALIMSETASCNPLFILGERYISDNERLFMELLRRGLGKWRVLPRGWTGRMINAKINSAPGNGTNCWNLLIVFEGFLLIIHPERTEGWGVWCWTYPSFSQGRLRSLALLSHLSGISGSGLPLEIDLVAKLSLSGVISEIKKKNLCTREHKLD